MPTKLGSLGKKTYCFQIHTGLFSSFLEYTISEYFGVLSSSAIPVGSLQSGGYVDPLANSRKRCPQNVLVSLDSDFFRGAKNIQFSGHSHGPGE